MWWSMLSLMGSIFLSSGGGGVSSLSLGSIFTSSGGRGVSSLSLSHRGLHSFPVVVVV